MGLSTLNGSRVTSARVTIPAWGCWHADATIDSEVTIAPGARATLVIADLTLVGTVLSGGPALGRSSFRIVAGNGGWGTTIKKWSYADDAGVKLSKAIGDAAREAGETMVVDTSARIGPAWTRPEGRASETLNSLAPASWFVDEAGTTRLGSRTAGTLPAKVTRITPVDRARGKVVLASDAIASILPGVVVDGLTAVDVQHDVSAEDGLRSTIWGGTNGSAAESVRKLVDALDPDRKFRGVTEYRVDTRNGSRLNLQPVRVSTGMPELKNVPVRPGLAGCETEVALGARVLVGFVEADQSRPFVAGFEDADGDLFQPSSISLRAGGMAGGEHVATVEATALMIYNTLVVLMAAAGGGPLIAAVLQPLLGTAVLAALTAQGVPAPASEAAQIAASTAQLAGFATGVVPATTSQYFAAAIALLATKTANASGYFPSVGSKAVEAG